MSTTNLLLAAKATLTEPSLAEGAINPITLNADGRVRVATKPGLFPLISGDLVTLASQLSIDVTDSSNVVLHVKNTGTVSMIAGAFSFEGSVDSTNGIDGAWFGVQAARTNANTTELTTGTLSLAATVGTAYAWELSVNALRWMRIRCSTAVTVGSTATWSAIRGAYATEPIPVIQTHAVTGSGTFTTGPVAATAYALTSAATTNAAVVKATGAKLMEISVFNPTAAVIYAKLYNKATAPIVGTDVPLVTIPVPVNGLVSYEFGAVGKGFTLGMGIAITAGPTAADVAVVAVGAVVSASYI